MCWWRNSIITAAFPEIWDIVIVWNDSSCNQTSPESERSYLDLPLKVPGRSS